MNQEDPAAYDQFADEDEYVGILKAFNDPWQVLGLFLTSVLLSIFVMKMDITKASHMKYDKPSGPRAIPGWTPPDAQSSKSIEELRQLETRVSALPFMNMKQLEV